MPVPQEFIGNLKIALLICSFWFLSFLLLAGFYFFICEVKTHLEYRKLVWPEIFSLIFFIIALTLFLNMYSGFLDIPHISSWEFPFLALALAIAVEARNFTKMFLHSKGAS